MGLPIYGQQLSKDTLTMQIDPYLFRLTDFTHFYEHYGDPTSMHIVNISPSHNWYFIFYKRTHSGCLGFEPST